MTDSRCIYECPKLRDHCAETLDIYMPLFDDTLVQKISNLSGKPLNNKRETNWGVYENVSGTEDEVLPLCFQALIISMQIVAWLVQVICC